MLMLLSPAAAEVPAVPPAPEVRNDLQDYRLGPGDVVEVGVFGVRELSKTARISNSGKIHFPSLGVLQVSGMSPSELGANIAQRLRDAALVKDPSVQVRVTEYRAQPVYILGEVMMPGQFVITNEMYLADLITLAAGFNEVASPVGYLYRRQVTDANEQASAAPQPAVADEEPIKIDFAALTSGSHPELNLRLRGGDILYVPVRPRIRYFVIGDVRQTGGFEMKAGDRILATAALAKAGGPTRTAKLSKGILVRYDEVGERQELPVDFDAILRGKKPDFEVLSADVIFIPGSSAKTLGYGLLNTIPSIVGRAAMLP